MEQVDPDAPFDPYSEMTLREVIDRDIDHEDVDGSLEYHGFHISPHGDGDYSVSYASHAGEVMRIEKADYNDVLQLVADLNSLLIKANDFDYRDDTEGLVEWAGKIVTSDEERAAARPDLYIHIPDEPLEFEDGTA